MKEMHVDPCNEFTLRIGSVLELVEFINTGIDPVAVYNILLDRLASQLRINATVLLVKNSYNILEYAAGRGFRSNRIRHSKVSIGQGLAGRAALFNEPLILNPDSIEKMRPSFKALLQAEGFQGYMAIPIMASNKVKGVIELMDKDTISLDLDEMQYLRIVSGLGGMTISKAENAVAIDKAKFELEKAYGETLEAWVRAMELRDKYTAGHNQRVTEMTLRLSAKLGIPNEMLLHITRGALLHDIGKLAISDKILLKTGPLNEKEREIIRQHPIFAHQLLKPIKYLEHAVDIPYCHHEMWSGEGYPQGLKEEEIPLNARIFSVADVWDALISDRPYRKAWPKEEALDYIESKSGVEFDPVIVDAFVEIINSEGTGPIGVEKSNSSMEIIR